MSDYDKLQYALQTQCTEAASVLSQTDLIAWQLVTCSDPQSMKEAAALLSDDSAFPTCLWHISTKSPLPFLDHVGTSINIWKPFWDIDKEFSVRISRPVDSHKEKPVYFDMDRAYFSLVRNNGRWKHKLQQLPDNRTPLTHFKSSKHVFATF